MTLPIRLRLTLIFIGSIAVVLALLGSLFYVRLAADLLDSVDLGLRSRAQVLIDATTDGRVPASLLDAGSLIDADEAFAQLLAPTGDIIDASPGVADAALMDPGDVRSVTEATFSTTDYADFDDPVRLLAVPMRSPPGAVIVVGATLGDLNDALGRVVVLLAIIGPIALAAMTVAAWMLAGAALRPVERMRREAAAVTASDLDRRLPVPRTGDELARLAATLNTLLDRLQEAMERDRRFVDDASHELRTPLATLRAEIDLALAKDRPAAELTAALERAQGDVARLQRLADDLLVLARSRGGRIPVRRVATALPELLRRSVGSVERQARIADVTIELDAPVIRVDLDPERVEQAIRNLLENAIRHTPAGGRIGVAARQVGDTVVFEVADTGPGFAIDLVGSAFDPFVRGDGEPDAAGGAGLGLTIVRAVAEAHGGAAAAENGPSGALVRITIRA